MNKPFVLASLLLLLVLSLAACSRAKPTPTPTSAPAATAKPAATATVAPTATSAPTATRVPTPTTAPTATTAPTPVPTPAPLTFNVKVGGEDLSQALTFETFLPSDLTVDVGDSITFTKKTAEPHSVTFNAQDTDPPPFLPRPDGKLEANPLLFPPSPAPSGPQPAPGASLNLSVKFDGTGYLNSGILNTTNDVFKVTFTKAGTYKYVCLLHAAHMNGTITVSSAGTPYPKTAADYDKEEPAHLALHQTNAKALFDTLKVPTPATAADGSRTFTAFAAAGDNPTGNDFFRFIGGESLTVKAGDKITWTIEKNRPGVPHTITLLALGVVRPDLVVPEPQPQGPPKLIVDPKVQAPAPQATAPYAGSGYFNSGLLVSGSPTPQNFSLTFTTPGTYKYLCIVHDEAGMNGTITVQAR